MRLKQCMFALMAMLLCAFSATAQVTTGAALTEALAAGGEVTLGADIEVTAQIEIPAGKTVVLDLAGYDIIGGWNGSSTTNHIYALSNRGTLTIKDSGTEGKIVSRGIYNYGTLTLESGIIDACDGNGGYAINNESGSTFIMNGGVVSASYEDGDAPGNYDATALDVPEDCTATLNGGKITSVTNFTFAISLAGELIVPETSTVEVTGAHGAISMSAGSADIDGGTFICSGVQGQTDNVVYVTGGSMDISGGTFEHTGNLVNADSGAAVVMSGANGVLTISGGEFTGLNGSVSGNANTTLTGGSYGSVLGYDSWDNIKQYVPEGETVTIEGESYTNVAPAVAVAKVNGVEYTDLQEAIKDAAPAGTVELLSNVVVDEWIMFSETLSIGSGDIITTQINGLTINGNGKTVTIKDIESAGNGARLFYDATNLNINDLTFNFVDNAANLGGIGLTAGTIKNVTFNGGGYAIFPGTGAVTIEGCTFKTNATSIYYEEERDNLVVTGNTFENPDNVNVILLRGNTTFTGNNVISGRTVNVVSGSPVVTGNDFNDVRFKVYNVATATIENNTINTLAFDDESVVVNSTFANNTLSQAAQTALAAAKFPVAGLLGEGTETSPYLISNKQELLWFQDKVDEQAADGSTQFAGKYFKLTADIDLDGENWNPIGSMSGDHGSFKGVFDGGDHTISNLKVEQAGNGIGLFARTAGNAVIKNLKLKNVSVKSTDNSNYAGAVVGNAYASTKIENVHVSGNVLVSGRGYIGGIAGHGYVVMDNVSVVATGDGQGNDKGLITSTFWCAGGILGYGGEGATNIMNANVENVVVTSAAGGLGAIVGMAEDNNGTQPISGSNLSAKNVEIKTYTGAYGDSYANYALGYLYGGNPTSKLTGELSMENVTLATSNGVAPTPVDAVAKVNDAIYFSLQKALDAAAAQAGETVTLIADVNENVTVADNVTIDGAGKNYTGTMTVNTSLTVTIQNVNFVKGSIAENKGTSGNLTIKGCTFDGDNGIGYAISVRGAEKLTIENSTAKKYSSGMLYIPSAVASISVKDVTVENVTAAFNISYSGDGTFENVTVKNATYGLNAQNYGSRTFTLKNWTLENVTGEAFRVQEKGTAKVTFRFEGCTEVPVLPSSEYAIIEGATVDGTNYYGSVQGMVEKAVTGQTVKLLSDIAMTEADCVAGADRKVLVDVAGKDITLDMNGKTISVVHKDEFTNDYIVAVVRVGDGAGLTVTGNGTIDVQTLDLNPDIAYMFWKRGTTGHLTIKNGTYKMNDSADSMVYTNGNEIVTIEGGTWELLAYGTRENRQPWIFNVQGAGDNHVIVTGGTFNADINRQHWSNEVLVPETHYTVANADSTAFTVKEGAKAYVNEGMLTGPYFVRKNIGYPTFVDAVAGVDKNETITLLEDVTLEAVVTTETDSITIDLNEKTVTGADGAIVFNIKADATIKNGTILGNKSGTTSGLIDIYANLAMDSVTLETSKINALRFKTGDCTATLDNCNITGAFKGYGSSVWAINSGTYKAASTSINDQLNGTAQISGGTFHYEITDEECAPGYSVVNNGDGTYTVKYAPVCFVDTNNNGTLDEGETVYGSLAAVFNTIKEGDVYIVLTSNTAIAEQVDTDANAKYYLNTNVAEGVTVDFTFADDWNYVQKMYVGKGVTLNAPYLLAWTDLEVHGTINTGYLYTTVANVVIAEGGVVNATTGDATVQVKNGANLTVNGELNTSTLNVWVGESKLIVSGVNAKVNAKWVDIWDGTPVVDIENGATLAVENIKASRGGSIEVSDATLAATGTIELGHNGESTGTLTETGNSTITGNIKLTVEGSTVKSDGGLTNVTTDLVGYGVVYENGEYKVVALPVIAKIGDVEYYSLQEALNAAAAGTGNVTVEILADVNLTGIDWNPVTVSAPGYPVVTVEGNGKTITGLNDMLFAGTWAGKSGLIIKNLTIAESAIVNDKNDAAGTVGVGAFIGYPQASATITLENCHLMNSSVEGGHWTGGLIGMAGGYNGEDGPVFMNLTITGCSVTGSTITGKGSVGGIIGHGSCADWTNVVIENTTVSGNTITSTGSSTNKAGAVMGTIGAAGQPATANGVTKTGGASVSATVAGNTVTSNGTEITTIYGRQGTSTGQLYVAGGSYDKYPIEQGVAYAAPIEGYEIVENADGTYGIQEIPAYVAKIGETSYTTLADAVSAAQAGETVTLLADVETADGIVITDKNLVIDLNSKTYTTTEGASTNNRNFKIEGTSVVTIKNGTMVAAGDYSSGAYGTVRTEGSANVTLEGLKLYNYRGNGLNIKACGSSVVTINDTEIYSNYGGGIESAGGTIEIANVKVEQKGMYTAPYNSMAISVNGGGKVTVNSGTFSTECITAEEANNQGTSHGPWVAGVLNSGGTLIINGGTFSNDNFGENSLATYARGAILADTKAKVEINGGKFNVLKNVIDIQNNLGDANNNPSVVLAGGTYNADPRISASYSSNLITLADGYAALPDLNGNYVVGVKPTATVHNLGMTTVAAGDYSIWNGSFDQNTEDDGDMPLSFVMQFLADQDAEDMTTSPYADWYGDFVITFTGLENGSFTADGCYLAGHYGSFGWVKVPVDGMTIEEGARYPVMLGVGMGQKYDYICSGVQDFKCALYLTPEILEANPNIQVKLELAVVDNSKGSDVAASALVNNDKVYSVTEYIYDADDFVVDPNYIAELVIDDAKGENYTNDTEKTVGTLTYKRTLVNGKWNALYLPFEVELTDELLANYDFADYNQMISHDTNGDRVPDSFEMELFIYTSGTLEANYPYFVRPKNEEACSMNLVLTDATLYPANENSLVTSSVKNTFKLSGTYSAMDAAALAGKYAISIDGDWSYTSALKPYRLYLTITDNNGAVVASGASKSVRIVVRGEDGYTGVEEITGENGEEMIFDLQGRRVLKPEKGGMYIINGKKVIY